MNRWWCADWTTCDFAVHRRWRPLREGEQRSLGETPVAVTVCDHSADDRRHVEELMPR